jgi:ABC-type nitrate/sulfonate/bicarbonate transport system substrate-binding protein
MDKNRFKQIARRLTAFAVTGVLLLAFHACGSSSVSSTSTTAPAAAPAGTTSPAAAEETAAKELFTIRVPQGNGVTEYYVADKLGFFAEEGIKIETVQIGTEITVEQAAEQGIIDYLTGGHVTGFARAQLAGIQAVATHPGMVDNDTLFHIAYYVRSDSSIQKLDDLGQPNPNSGDGKWKFGVNGTGTCILGYPLYYLKTHNLDTQYVQFVTLDEAVQLQSLTSGQLDISAVHSQRQPEADLLIENGEVRRVSSSWEMFGDEYAGLSIRGFLRPFIDEHREDGIVQSFSNAHYKARVWLNDEENRQLALQWSVDDFGLDPTKVAFQRFTEDLDINEGAIDRWFEIAYIAGEFNPEDPVNPEDTYTNEFAAKVAESRDSIIARRPPAV